MMPNDYPSLFQAADELSNKTQSNFFRLLAANLLLLIAAAALSSLPPAKWVAFSQIFVLLSALYCSVVIYQEKPSRLWYVSRAVAESVKTLSWKFALKSHPFDTDDVTSTDKFHSLLKEIIDQNIEAAQKLCIAPNATQISSTMRKIRNKNLDERKIYFEKNRIRDQLFWYSKKSEFNQKRSTLFFRLLFLTNAAAIIFSILRIEFIKEGFWYTDITIAIAASILSWQQSKKYSELGASYALAANEISIIKSRAHRNFTEAEFSNFVAEAENAFSREHTQWTARKD